MENTFKRRASDFTPEGNLPTIHDAWLNLGLLSEKNDALDRRITLIESAFTLNDLGKPDFEGHRKTCVEMTEAKKVVSSYKQDATKKILGAGLLFLISMMGAGLLDWIKTHLK